jgi:hypothetical protein
VPALRTGESREFTAGVGRGRAGSSPQGTSFSVDEPGWSMDPDTSEARSGSTYALLRRIECWEGGRVQGTLKLLLLAAGTTRLGTCRRRICMGDGKGGDDEVGEVRDAPEAKQRGLIRRRPLLLVRCGVGTSSSRVTPTHWPVSLLSSSRMPSCSPPHPQVFRRRGYDFVPVMDLGRPDELGLEPPPPHIPRPRRRLR